ncbi:peroxide stress protein YaaA [Mangrovibacterium lignilyticum]|uniref:peroxide stress protein YaaA n=1 Tax=Mangrovibacterium lignilyticum TaxID=2668052 RepID=UPI0013D2B9A9|nr:peroxide stress protein YaaA [Mangrovibacterium lignilyticum]
MIAIISPAKSLDFETKPVTQKHSELDFLAESTKLNSVMKKLKTNDLVKMMGISAKLASLNVDRNLSWAPPFTPENAKQAILAFNGDVYSGLQADTFSEEQFDFVQDHLRILSGLYGVLKPLDLIQPYRLEMGIKLPVEKSKDLYQFWQHKITEKINALMAENDGVLINLASVEYFKSIDQSKFKGKIITPEFKDNKDGKYKIISFYAKRARGLMCRFMVENKITNPEELKAFDMEGYHLNNELTNGNKWVFTRDK